MPGPSPKLLQLGHDNAVVDLVPTVHDQMAGHGIHGVELAAGVGGTRRLRRQRWHARSLR